jgi:hypothetical protein
LLELERYGELENSTIEELPHSLSEGSMLLEKCKKHQMRA